ncbi:hypothetical protein EOS_35510 [Caballeronia mineralivorans PML1(12)]|uniref:F-box domain-containing protein n=1 Tax=Caballeronia mineralivorans PML1(12) TaxID=908627 RepID=A0A0J1CL47_9BURK|nr:hypothetical protein [Caballeronia mineralivorans]KLU21485.1 hypothetical protein EOS_35510 [Caballeronia mineralivorans PML1(12)]
MLAPQSYDRDHSASMYRTTLREAFSGRRSLIDISPELSFPDKNTALEWAFDQIDQHNEQNASVDSVREYMKASFGIESECDNADFKRLGLELSMNRRKHFFLKNVTCSSVDLAAKIYSRTVGAERAFPGGRHLDQDDFIHFVARRLDTSPDVVRAAIRDRYLRAILMTKDERRSHKSGSEITEVKVQVNDAEFWMEIKAESRLDHLPTELVASIVEFLPSVNDRARLAMTNRALNVSVSEALNAQRLIREAAGIKSQRDVETWLLGERKGEFEGLHGSDRARLLSVMAGSLGQIKKVEERTNVFVLILNFTLFSLGQAQWVRPLVSLADAIGVFETENLFRPSFNKMLDMTETANGLSEGARVAVFAALTSSLCRLTTKGRYRTFDRLLAALERKCPGERGPIFALALSRLPTLPGFAGGQPHLGDLVGGLLIAMIRLPGDGRPPALRFASLFESGAGETTRPTLDTLIKAAHDPASEDRPILWLALSSGFDILPFREIEPAINKVIVHVNNEVEECKGSGRIDIRMIDTLLAVSATQIRRLPSSADRYRQFVNLWEAAKHILLTVDPSLRWKMSRSLRNLRLTLPLLPRDSEESKTLQRRIALRFYDFTAHCNSGFNWERLERSLAGGVPSLASYERFGSQQSH